MEIVNSNPDILIYGVYGHNYRNFNCKKILFSGENLRAAKEDIPHYEDSDVCLSYYSDKPKEIFVPLWIIHTNWFDKKQPRPLPCNPAYCITLKKIQDNRQRFLKKERKFCAFINNNPIQDRMDLFNHLHSRKHIDSFGKLLNNTGAALRGSQKDKVDLLWDYKFTISFENSYHAGYNTEKITEPMEVGCIPIYNGGERVKEYFNPDSFIDFKDFTSIEKLSNRILEIDSDKDLYEHMVLAPPLKMDKIMKDFKPSTVLNKILTALDL